MSSALVNGGVLRGCRVRSLPSKLKMGFESPRIVTDMDSIYTVDQVMV